METLLGENVIELSKSFMESVLKEKIISDQKQVLQTNYHQALEQCVGDIMTVNALSSQHVFYGPDERGVKEFYRRPVHRKDVQARITRVMKDEVEFRFINAGKEWYDVAPISGFLVKKVSK